MTQIGPQDLLGIGIKVQVGNKRGKVIKAEFVQSSNQMGMICLHTIELNTIRKTLYGKKFVWEPIKPEIQEINYASIYVI